ncbi:MAG: hypothetical protein LBL80_05860 [Ruminococcus sp.]|jgi:TRAP-type mannitol/chloroaromatic compound transport system permease large subunit|nr:hypothetical protein [Ruminococcus sp.]
MTLNISALFLAIGCSVVSLIIAGIGGDKAGRERLSSLTHPDNSFMLKVMPVLGFVYYNYNLSE